MFSLSGALGKSNGDPLDVMLNYFTIAGNLMIETDADLIIRFCYINETAEQDEFLKTLNAENLMNQYLPDIFESSNTKQVEAFLENNKYPLNKRCEDFFIDKGAFYISVHLIPFGVDGEFHGYRLMLFSSAYRLRHKWEQEVPQHIRQQELITSISLKLAATDDYDQFITEVCGMVGDFLLVNRVSVFKDNIEESCFTCLYEWSSAGTEQLKDCLPNLYYDREGEELKQLYLPFVTVDDIDTLPDNSYLKIREIKTKAFVRIPIFIDRALWGFAAFDTQQPREWTTSEMNLLQSVHGIMVAVIKTQFYESELSEAFSKLQGIVKSYPGAIWCIDNNYKVTLCEGEIIKSFGIEPANAIGHSIYEFYKVVGDSASSLIKHTEQTFNEGPLTYVSQFMDKHVTCNTSLLYGKKGEVTGQLGVALDITEVQRMQQQLELTVEEVQKANLAKSEFLSRMSHEIRTPMNAIVGMNTIARSTRDPEKIAYCLEKIDGASKQMLEIINNILDMSKIEANKFELTENEFDFEKMLANVCNVVNVRADEKRINFTVDFPELFSKSIICDELRLTQVLINLLVNAIKFTPEEGNVTVKVRHNPIDDNKLNLKIDVTDDGIGIPKDQLERLFNAFEQADGSTTRKFGGTGLGLAICKKIITLMGGTITVQSEVGKGSTFSFSIDVKWGKNLDTAIVKPVLNKKNVQVLVVDDSDDVRTYFENVLENFGINCDTSHSGMDSIEKVKTAIMNEKPYNLIFVDWMMPGLNGIETARRILELVKGEAIVIMISVADWSEIEIEASQIGVDKFLPKPVLPSALLDAITKWTDSTIMKEEHNTDVQSNIWSRKTILLAEDIDINQEIIISVLADTKINIECAENGKVAFEMYQQAPDKYDAILMDVQMPLMDGLDATRKIRKSGLPYSRTIPIIAMTANAFKADVEECLASGMDDHISKPIDLDELLTKLSMYLERVK